MSPKQALFSEMHANVARCMNGESNTGHEASIIPIYGTMSSSDHSGQGRLPHLRTYSVTDPRPDKSRPNSIPVAASTITTRKYRSRSMPSRRHDVPSPNKQQEGSARRCVEGTRLQLYNTGSNNNDEADEVDDRPVPIDGSRLSTLPRSFTAARTMHPSTTLSSPNLPKHRLDALIYPSIDSPTITKERIGRAVAGSAKWRCNSQTTIPAADFVWPAPDSRNSSSLSSNSYESLRSSSSSMLQEGITQDSDGATSLEASESGDDDDAESLDPKPTPTHGAGTPTIESTGFQTEASLYTRRLPAPEELIPTGIQPRTKDRRPSQHAAHKQYRACCYGTPEMPRGSANLPLRASNLLNLCVPSSSYVKHLPRAEKLPLTGYALTASKLASQGRHFPQSQNGGHMNTSTTSPQSRNSASTGTTVEAVVSQEDICLEQSGEERVLAHIQIKPLYRKFEALNHRILLHLQDELSELEEQLHRFDTADTQTRRLQNRILPASRRAELLAGGELQWHKANVLGKIGHKLEQYSRSCILFAIAYFPKTSTTDTSRSCPLVLYQDTKTGIAELL